MSGIRKLERDEIRRMYIATFKAALKEALAHHDDFSHPEARKLTRHPIYGFGVGVELNYHGRHERREALGEGAATLEEGESEDPGAGPGDEDGVGGGRLGEADLG